MQNNTRIKILFTTLIISAFIFYKPAYSQTKEKPMAIIAYYVGAGTDLDKYNTDKLTHIIYSFLHLKGNNLVVDNTDSLTITRLVALKRTNPYLKVLVSLGGWGGCKTCSQVFNTESGRREFSLSVLQILKDYHVDGLDLDWEYPAIESLPGHQFLPEDRVNFTWLIKSLRETIGPDYVLSFAAGGFKDYLTRSVEWGKVMPLVNYVNVMSYDLVNGYSKRTGHLTSLYSTAGQIESTDNTVMFLDSIGVPMQKIVIGMAFYARTFSGVKPDNNGLYQKGKFSDYINYKDFDKLLSTKAGFIQYWDNKAKAPYAYNAATHTFATFDNLRSVYEKTKYAKAHHLGGVMFWELSGDKPSGGLLDMIYEGSSK